MYNIMQHELTNKQHLNALHDRLDLRRSKIIYDSIYQHIIQYNLYFLINSTGMPLTTTSIPEAK